MFPVVAAAMERRFQALDKPLWCEAIAELLNRRRQSFFRWHDSGDLQSVAHLARIVRVCELTPQVRHWLPTREYKIVTDYVSAGGEIPANLEIRMSVHMIGGHVPTFPRLKGLVSVSTVSSDEATYPEAHQCPAPSQGGMCGDCRACWSPDVPHVNYHLH